MVSAVAAPGASAISRAWAVLEAIPDPEIPVVSIRELGILREIHDHGDGTLEVVITPTYSGCPAMGQIEDDIRTALGTHGLKATVVTRLAPGWTTDWITPEAKPVRQRGPLRFKSAKGNCGLSALRQRGHHRNLALQFHRLQGAVPLPGLPRTVRLFQKLLMDGWPTPEAAGGRFPLKGAPPAARRSRFCGGLGTSHFL
jgi:metal-sulfur cluster biosynthetic enzyme